jgi:hypothetical protein
MEISADFGNGDPVDDIVIANDIFTTKARWTLRMEKNNRKPHRPAQVTDWDELRYRQPG